MKKMKTIVILLLLLETIVFVPSVTALYERGENPSTTMISPIIGLFPKMNGDTITFLALPPLPPFQWITIEKKYFDGYVGLFIIIGSYNWTNTNT